MIIKVYKCHQNEASSRNRFFGYDLHGHIRLHNDCLGTLICVSSSSISPAVHYCNYIILHHIVPGKTKLKAGGFRARMQFYKVHKYPLLLAVYIYKHYFRPGLLKDW